MSGEMRKDYVTSANAHKGFSGSCHKIHRCFLEEKELERTSINPISVCLHRTLGDPVVWNVLSYSYAAGRPQDGSAQYIALSAGISDLA